MFSLRRLAGLVLLLLPGVASAQRTGAVDLSTCTYDACALRVSTRVFHGVGIQRGLEGPIVPFGFSGGSVVRAVAGVPAAVLEAEAGRRKHLRGSVASIIGSVASISLGLLANREANSGTMRRNLWIGSAIGGGVAFVGATQIARGDEHFSRAIWLYNKELPRER